MTGTRTTMFTDVYCQALDKELKYIGYSRSLRKRFVEEMEASLQNYLAEHPVASLEELCGLYGTPEQAAKDAIQAMGTEYIRRELRAAHWKRLAVILIVGLALAYAVWKLGSLAVNSYMSQPVVIISAPIEFEGPLPTEMP